MTKKTQKGRTGRPRQDLTQATMDRICREVALGRSLRSILKAKGMPSMPKVLETLQEDAEFAAQYARGRRQGIELHIDGILDLADTATEKNAQAVRLKLDTRKWLASKLAPRVYGDRIELGGELQITDRRAPPSDQPLDLWTREQKLEWMRRQVFLLAIAGKELRDLWGLPDLGERFGELGSATWKRLLAIIEGRADIPGTPAALAAPPRQITAQEVASGRAEGRGEREIEQEDEAPRSLPNREEMGL